MKGKSLFVDTLKELFEGNKELFEDLYVYDKWDWDDKYPVIQISMASSKSSRELFLNSEINKIRYNFEKFDLTYSEVDEPEVNFYNLIQKVSEKFNKRVVVLIDEYDKPILDRIDNDIEREWAKAKLSDLYSIKDLIFISLEFDTIINPKKFVSDKLILAKEEECENIQGLWYRKD